GGIEGVAVGVSLSITLNFVLMLRLSKSIVAFEWKTLISMHLRCLVLAGWIASGAAAGKWFATNLSLPALGVLLAGASSALIFGMFALRYATAALGPEGRRMCDLLVDSFPRATARFRSIGFT